MEVKGSVITDTVITALREYCPFPIGDGEAPSEALGGGLIFQSYAVVSRAGTWRYEGDDYSGQRGGMEELQFQVTGIGLGRTGSERPRDQVLEVMAAIDDADGEYLYPITDPAEHKILTRRSGSVLMPQPSGRGTFNAPAYFLVMVARSG